MPAKENNESLDRLTSNQGYSRSDDQPNKFIESLKNSMHKACRKLGDLASEKYHREAKHLAKYGSLLTF